jgi:hypothetical protein
MAKSLRDSLGRRMRAADGSSRVVFGGSDAEKAFAANQLLQQQLMTQNAPQALTGARTEAAKILQQNLDRGQDQQQFAMNLAQQQAQERNRVAAERERQRLAVAEAASRAGLDQQRIDQAAKEFSETMDYRGSQDEIANQLARDQFQSDAYGKAVDATFKEQQLAAQLQRDADTRASDERRQAFAEEQASLDDAYRNRVADFGQMMDLSNLGMRQQQFQATQELDKERLQQSATQFAQQLALNERTLEESSASRQLSQNISTGKMAEQLLSDARSMDLTDEGQKELAKLSSAYRQIAKQQVDMRPNQYNSLMQDWATNFEKANLSQYQNVNEEFLPSFGERFQTYTDPATGLQYEVYRKKDGEFEYNRITPESGSTSSGVRTYKNRQEYLDDVASDPKKMKALDGQIRDVLDAENKEVTAENYAAAARAIAEQQLRSQEGFALAQNRPDGTVYGTPTPTPQEQEPKPKQLYPTPEAGLRTPTYGSGAREQQFSPGTRWFRGFFGGGAPTLNARRLDNTEADEIFNNARKLNQTAFSRQDIEKREKVLADGKDAFFSSPEYKKLKSYADKGVAGGPPIDITRILDTNAVTKIVRLGIDKPLEKLAQGMVEAIENGEDHIAYNGLGGSSLSELNLPVFPRESLEAKDMRLEDLPLVFMDEYGKIYRKQTPPAPKRREFQYGIDPSM